MKIKRLTALALAGIMTLSLAACGSGNAEAPTASTGDNGAAETKTESKDSKGDEVLTVWTLSDDLKQFAEKFTEETGTKVEVTVIAPADYPTKVQSALLAGEKDPDIIVGEPQMLGSMYEAEFFANLDDFGAQDYADKIVDYVWQVGKDANGVQRAISYQVTPAGIYYRGDIAEKVFGTSDPAEIGKKFSSYPEILKAGDELKKAGYKIFASDGELNYFSGDSAWVVDNKLNVAQARLDYMDTAVSLYQNEYTAFAQTWSAPWYQAMSSQVPILKSTTNVWDEAAVAADAEGAELTEVFAYGLPTWGTLVMRDSYGDTKGLWKVCNGPSYGFGGGTFMGVSNYSDSKELGWEFVKFCTLTETTLDWWIEKSEGDVVSYIPCLEKHANDENPVYGNQKLYAFWAEQAKGIDYSKVTKYDQAIGDAWGQAITAIKEGAKSKEDAINEFYDIVASTYPELTIER